MYLVELCARFGVPGANAAYNAGPNRGTLWQTWLLLNWRRQLRARIDAVRFCLRDLPTSTRNHPDSFSANGSSLLDPSGTLTLGSTASLQRLTRSDRIGSLLHLDQGPPEPQFDADERTDRSGRRMFKLPF
jgi:hypothetical protein